jgi:quinol-cytochrome oxidoreductase complex cytochrome b subunit/mono/diheme cytochrome c family protein
MRIQNRILVISASCILLTGAALLSSKLAPASADDLEVQATPEPYNRPGPPPTIYPPSQGDNGAQVFWGMCQDCHGDRGQGLTAEWRAAFPPEYQDCWTSGCHGEDRPANSFEIPAAGGPALAGPGALPQFPTAFELGDFIQENMPLSPTNSLSANQTWELVAFLLRLNDQTLDDLTLSGRNSAAIQIHHVVPTPRSALPGTLLLAVVLIFSAVAVSLGAKINAHQAEKDRKGSFYHHLHPPRIPALQARLSYTLGTGGLAVFFSLILLITGALEMYYYIPTPVDAGRSIQLLATLVPYGYLVRNLHYWSAQLLVVTVTIHLLRVVLTGAYAPPRRFNYLLGMILLVLILLLNFTGYVLRWDEGIRWALVVGTNLLKTIPGIGERFYQFIIGGPEPGPAALTRFYSWHIFGLTLAAAGVTGWHIFRTRRDGGIAASPKMKKRGNISRFELVRQEVIAMLVAGAILLILSVSLPAPIDQPLVENGALTGDSRAPWFFLWIQELLKLGSPFLWGVGVPLLVVLFLGLVPYVLPNTKEEEWGRWLPQGNRTAQIIVSLVIVIIFALTILGAAR